MLRPIKTHLMLRHVKAHQGPIESLVFAKAQLMLGPLGPILDFTLV